MPVLQRQNAETPVGLKIPPVKHNQKEIQDIAYLLAHGKISEKAALEMYEKLLRTGARKNSLLRRILRELFPNLGA